MYILAGEQCFLCTRFSGGAGYTTEYFLCAIRVDHCEPVAKCLLDLHCLLATIEVNNYELAGRTYLCPLKLHDTISVTYQTTKLVFEHRHFILVAFAFLAEDAALGYSYFRGRTILIIVERLFEAQTIVVVPKHLFRIVDTYHELFAYYCHCE
ncbi:hypothetical protein D3C76_859240 [compost metagenome]